MPLKYAPLLHFCKYVCSFQGDDFINLLKPNYNSAAQYCRALFQQASDAEDRLQDAILTAMQKFHTLKDESKIRSWCLPLSPASFINQKRKKQRESNCSLSKLFWVPVYERQRY